MFTRKLLEWQRETGQDDEAFAARLGITRPYWVMLRTGKRAGGARAQRLIARALKERPELEFYVMADLRALRSEVA